MQELTLKEIEVIKQIADYQIKSLVALAEHGDIQFDGLLQIEDLYEVLGYDADGKEIWGDKVNKITIFEDLTMGCLEFEKVLEEPEHIFRLPLKYLRVCIYLTDLLLPKDKYPNTRKRLMTRLNIAYSLCSQTSLN